jgi:hypothetical protein
MGFLATLMALVPSHLRRTWEHSSQKSLNVYVIQSSYEQQLAAATYSAPVVDWATQYSLLEMLPWPAPIFGCNMASLVATGTNCI